MYKKERSFYSKHLQREMYFREYGHAGKPMIVFPSSGGSYYEYEDFGMIEACKPFIDQGLIRVYTPDSIDQESWMNDLIHPYERAAKHNAYDLYIVEELAGLIYHETNWEGEFISTGCSLGAYHALNFLFRHPDIFDTVIALSGIYDIRYFVGDEMNFDIYINSPTDYLKNLEDPWYLEKYRKSQIVICSGQGAWEDDTIKDTQKIAEILRAKNIPAWIDLWGQDVNHDWDWWRIQIVYFLNKILIKR